MYFVVHIFHNVSLFESKWHKLPRRSGLLAQSTTVVWNIVFATRDADIDNNDSLSDYGFP